MAARRHLSAGKCRVEGRMGDAKRQPAPCRCRIVPKRPRKAHTVMRKRGKAGLARHAVPVRTFFPRFLIICRRAFPPTGDCSVLARGRLTICLGEERRFSTPGVLGSEASAASSANAKFSTARCGQAESRGPPKHRGGSESASVSLDDGMHSRPNAHPCPLRVGPQRAGRTPKDAVASFGVVLVRPSCEGRTPIG